MGGNDGSDEAPLSAQIPEPVLPQDMRNEPSGANFDTRATGASGLLSWPSVTKMLPFGATATPVGKDAKPRALRAW